MWKVLLFLVALAVQAQDVAGRYSLTGVREMASEILLRPDGTFEFMLTYGAADYWGRGKWQKQGEAVILNSARQEQAPVKLVRSEAAKEEGIQIRVLSPQGQPIPNIDLLVKASSKNLKARTGSAGVAELPALSGPLAVVVQIRVYDFESSSIALNAAHNRFQLELDGRAITEMRFEGERLGLEGRTLLFRQGPDGKPMRYVKPVLP